MVIDEQVAGFPQEIGQALRQLVAERTDGDSLEAQLAKDADKLECLVQAREYEAQGNAEIQAWIESSLGALRSPSAKRLAQACLDTSPAEWWQAVTGYRPQTLD
jgi:putative hydrolase of HD superfamily